jgi:glycosyltransferase involved in cell wall biosynthesis
MTSSDASVPRPSPAPWLSVVVPLFNEEENVAPLIASVRAALGTETPWELVLVDDGSRDETAGRAAREVAGDSRVRLVRLARNYGQTQAMQAGFDHARGRVVVTMDGDLQNDPSDIPVLVDTLAQGYDLVIGYRVNRQDRLLVRKVPSWVANRLIARLTGVRVRDNGCSLKAYRGELLESLNLYSDMHRFLPALAAATADARIAEVPVRHHARRYGASKYGLSRVAKVTADLLTIKMISSFRERPLVLFGLAALGALGLGTATIAYSLVRHVQAGPTAVYAFVYPSIGMVWLTVAVTLLMLGLVGERALQAASRTGDR